MINGDDAFRRRHAQITKLCVATGKTNLVVICVDTLADRARVTKIKWRANF
jgi:hypothetical protein